MQMEGTGEHAGNQGQIVVDDVPIDSTLGNHLNVCESDREKREIE